MLKKLQSKGESVELSAGTQGVIRNRDKHEKQDHIRKKMRNSEQRRKGYERKEDKEASR